MPLTDRDCEDAEHDMVKAQREAHKEPTDDFVFAHGSGWLMKRLPRKEDRVRFREWDKARMKSSTITPRQPAASEYLRAVGKTNFTNDESRAQLLKLIDCRPPLYIGIGVHNGIRYRLVPCTDSLVVDSKRINWEDARKMFHECILGVNTIIEAKTTGTKHAAGRKRRREEASSDESDSSNDSTILNDSNGFTFFQLGRVEGTLDTDYQEMKKTNGSEADLYWSDTDFVLVTMVTSGGTASEAWLIYNFNPRDDISGLRYPTDEDTLNWGLLEKDPEQRAGVKIADEIWKLGPDVAWSMEKVMHKLDLVAAVIVEQPMGKLIVRQKVAEEPGKVEQGEGTMPLRV